MTNKKSVVVTGASTGIGWGIAKVLLARNFQVYGTVRKPADAARLQTEFGSDFFPLLLDITDESAVRSAAAQVKERLGQATLAGLVNNAGIAVAGPLLHLPLAGYRHQLEVNRWCLELGGHVRTGLEDNIKFDKDRLAKSNAELVARLAGLCGEYGRHAASCAEARSLLGLPAA